MNPTNFLTELKRRNVYRAAVAYGVVAWFLTQLTTQVFPFFEIPNSAVRFVVIALAVGFPIAMLLSWVYEFTPEGVVRTEDLQPAQARSSQRATGRILDFIIIGALLLVIAMLVVGRLPFYRQTGESISQKTIAVLPFENLSRDPDNAYFAVGIQEEILTRLAGIADLKVISRSSTQQYQSKPRNLREIAKQLGVANILEGSVQKAARLSRTHAAYYFGGAATPAHRDSAKRALENAQKLQPNSTETLLALGYYQHLVLRDYGLAKATFKDVRKMLPGSSDVPYALGRVARYEGHWDETIGYFEQALALDPRNTEVLLQLAWTYGMLRQFPAALKLYDRALDIMPNDPDVLALKASIYQAQGNLQETPRLLSGINEQSPSEGAFTTKINQLRLERNYGEGIRLLQARLAQYRFDSAYDKYSDQVSLALIQCLAGDTVGAKVTAEPARKTLEQLYRDQSERVDIAILLSWAYAGMGEKDLALRVTEQAIVLLPEAKDRVHAPSLKENLALIQTMVDENSHAISTLTQLLQTPYWSPNYYPAPITPALLRLDPLWDPLRGDPAFQKLCEEKQP